MLSFLAAGCEDDAVFRLRADYGAVPDSGKRDVVLFGGGPLGRRTAAALAKAGRPVLAFADNDPAKWGFWLDGVPVLSPRQAADLHGASATFVVTIYNGAAARAQLRDLGCAYVLHFAAFYHGLAEVLLPWYALEMPGGIFAAQPEICEAAGLWADDASRDEFAAQLAWRLGFAEPKLPAHESPKNCYFPPDLVTIGAQTHVVDCGAFDGDSLRLLLARGAPFGSFLGLEPDPENFARLNQFVATLPEPAREKITTRQCAVAATAGTLRFNARGSVASGLAADGEMQVRAVTLDEILAEIPANFIKMDIEGGELGALAGAKTTLRTKQPVLAISAYHAQSDLWEIPRAIKNLTPDYDLYLRRYAEDCWELVCYALPKAGA